MVDSTELSQVSREAEDIAQSVGQKLTTAHLLLAMFTLENRGAVLLREKGVDEDLILGLLQGAPAEPDGLVRELREKTHEVAANTGQKEADCLHLVIAISRLRCLAQDLLARSGLDLLGLRNTALSYYLSGRMPRKMQLGRDGPPGVPRASSGRAIGAPPMPLSHERTATLSPEPEARTAPRRTSSLDRIPMSIRDLVDENEATQPTAQPESVEVREVAPAASPAPVTPVARATKGRFSLEPETFPLLNALGRNLTELAHAGALDPVVGRAREIDEVIDVLGKRRTNNPCLVGEPGVGKTAVVEGVAQQLSRLAGALGDKVIVEIDMATLVAGTQLRGSFSEKLNALKDEVKRGEGRVIVFIDELHTLIGAGSTGDGPQDAANELKSAMARGEFPCIGATTHDEYRKHIQSDAALERRFTPVTVSEPTVSETVYILSGVIARYEEHHQLKYTPEALQASAALSSRYITDRFLPDKAISVADLAGSRCRREAKAQVEAADVARVVAKIAGLPEERLLLDDTARLLRLESDLKARVVGHDDVLSRIVRVIRRNYAGFSSRRPMGSFLFLGPTGVGKTELARALAEVLFGSRDALVRVDMSELAEAHAVSRLIGAPAGYVGYGDGGQLTEPIRRRPSSVVVLDEIEKAHRDVLMLLLQVMEEGRLTDGKGRHIDFSNTVVILTSNLGSEAFSAKSRAMGFGAAAQGPSQSDIDAACAVAKKSLPPELWNRIDERCAFRPLEEGEIARIALLLLAESSKRLATEKGIEYVADDAVIQHLLRAGGFDPQLGARPMRQTLQRLVEAPLAELILSGKFIPGDRVRVAVDSGGLAFVRA